MSFLSHPQRPRILAAVSAVILLSLMSALIASSRDGSALSWTTFRAGAPGGSYRYSMGYALITECWTSSQSSEYDTCLLQSLREYDVNMGGLCSLGGAGVVASYSVCLVLCLALLVLTLLPAHVKPCCAPRLLALPNVSAALSVLCVALSVTPIAVWYQRCQARLPATSVTYDDDLTRYAVEDVRVGSGVGLAVSVLVVALALCGLCLWRAVRDWRDSKQDSGVLSVAKEELLAVGKFSQLKDEDASAHAAATSTRFFASI